MGDDLEDMIFKQNVPGKYSRWQDDEQGNNWGDDEEQEEEGQAQGLEQYDTHNLENEDGRAPWLMNSSNTDKLLNDDMIPQQIKQGILHERLKGHNTGVKVCNLQSTEHGFFNFNFGRFSLMNRSGSARGS